MGDIADVRVNTDLGIFVVELGAVVTHRALLDTFRNTFADPTNLPTFNGVIDMRRAMTFDVSQNTLLALAAIVQEHRTIEYKVAHVVSTPLQIGMSNMCLAFTEMRDVEECQQFKDLKQACLFVCKNALARQKVFEGRLHSFDCDPVQC